jgi:hypothetical protein
MLYIHHTGSISTISEALSIDNYHPPFADNKIRVDERSFQGMPPQILRRMGKAARLNFGAADKVLRAFSGKPDGIITGTANGGMEDSVKFMNQIIEYDEGMLTPGNFVQSTPNGLASQVAMVNGNKGYNATHTHRGLSFENALLDAMMLCKENPDDKLLIGGVDEISSYNYNIDLLAGWYKKESCDPSILYNSATIGSIAGEGAALFVVSARSEGAIARISSIKFFQSVDQAETRETIAEFLATTEPIDVFVSGENGDSRFKHLYESCESLCRPQQAVIRYKHVCGEFPTASALAVYLACDIIKKQQVPPLFLKSGTKVNAKVKNTLIYNAYQGLQHSLILVQSA